MPIDSFHKSIGLQWTSASGYTSATRYLLEGILGPTLPADGAQQGLSYIIKHEGPF